ncbi:MAG: hypothetical protein ACC628_03120 [Pirellulaceae bacterium]
MRNVVKAAPATLQRVLESIKWDEKKLRDRCRQIVAKDHADPEAIGKTFWEPQITVRSAVAP